MVEKRGQATLFIILGIVLVIIVVLLFYTRTIELPRRFVETTQVSPVSGYVEQCVKEVVEEDVKERIKYGGYDGLTDNTIEGDVGEYNLFYNAVTSESYLPVRLEIENGISRNVEEYLDSPFCDLGRFGDADYTQLKVDSMLNEENILVTVFVPIRIGKGESSVIKDTFNVKVDSDLGKLWNIMYEIVELNWARNGEFNIDSFNEDHPGSEFLITGPHAVSVWSLYPNAKIYGVKRKDDNREMRFAVIPSI